MPLDTPVSPGPGYTWDAVKKQWIAPANPRTGSGQTGVSNPGAGKVQSATYGNAPTSTPVSGDSTATIWNMPTWMTKGTQNPDGSWTGAPKLWYGSGGDTANHYDPGAGQNVPGVPGAEDLKTPEQIFKLYAALSAADPNSKDGKAYKTIQDELALVAGATKAYRPGFLGDTESALSSAIAQWYKVSQSGVPVSFSDWLKNTASQAYQVNQAGGAQAPVSLMDPDQLAVDVQNAAQASLGHALTSAQVNAFVNEFHSQQMTSAGQKNALSNPYYDTNRAPASAQDFIAQNFTGDVENNRLQNGMNALLGSLLSGSQAPPSSDMPSILNAPGSSGAAPVTQAASPEPSGGVTPQTASAVPLTRVPGSA